MHLRHDQVAALVVRLQKWLASGSFNVPPEKPPAASHSTPV
jgi:hypothetical protein